MAYDDAGLKDLNEEQRKIGVSVGSGIGGLKQL